MHDGRLGQHQVTAAEARPVHEHRSYPTVAPKPCLRPRNRPSGPDAGLVHHHHPNAWRYLRFRRWFKVLLTGAAVWGVSVMALALSGDSLLVPTVVLLGSFTVPIAWTLRVSDREHFRAVTPRLLVRLFVAGGTLGFITSALAEKPFIYADAGTFAVGVGVVEEVSKLAMLAWIAREVTTRTPKVGFVLGAAVGFGFAAFENAGYALSAVPASGYHGWASIVDMELTRALTTPFTHGLWTAILGAALFHQSRNGRWRLTVPLVAAVAGVAAMHAAWDLMPNLAMSVDLRVIGGYGSAPLLPETLPTTASHAVRAMAAPISDVGLAAIGALGVALAHGIRGSAPRHHLAGAHRHGTAMHLRGSVGAR